MPADDVEGGAGRVSGRPLFDGVVAASGLNDIIAPFTISRLLLRADLTPEQLTAERLTGLLGDIEQGLGVYLGPDELTAALERIRALVAEERSTRGPRLD